MRYVTIKLLTNNRILFSESVEFKAKKKNHIMYASGTFTDAHGRSYEVEAAIVEVHL